MDIQISINYLKSKRLWTEIGRQIRLINLNCKLLIYNNLGANSIFKSYLNVYENKLSISI